MDHDFNLLIKKYHSLKEENQELVERIHRGDVRRRSIQDH